ncbi:MAG: D-aminoacyl-tRNA deacylase [Ruminococcus sp.]|nr:D-aminoacyl-tRNA deacylase [Ruminococcus sp.]
MKTVIQRVNYARVRVEGEIVGEIGKGFLILAGFSPEDTEENCLKAAKKIGGLRIFSDENDKINLSLKDVGGEILCISQFTLCADCSRGNRPSFTAAARPETARPLYDFFCNALNEYAHTEKGIFGADMKVTLENDGPFTVEIDM